MERDPLAQLGPDAQSVQSGPPVQPLGASTAPGGVAALLRSLRPDQWTKNLIVFAGHRIDSSQSAADGKLGDGTGDLDLPDPFDVLGGVIAPDVW